MPVAEDEDHGLRWRRHTSAPLRCFDLLRRIAVFADFILGHGDQQQAQGYSAKPLMELVAKR